LNIKEWAWLIAGTGIISLIVYPMGFILMAIGDATYGANTISNYYGWTYEHLYVFMGCWVALILLSRFVIFANTSGPSTFKKESDSSE